MSTSLAGAPRNIFNLAQKAFVCGGSIRCRVKTVIVLALATLLALTQREAAFAGSFKLIEDGKVQMNAFGETLLFRQTDAVLFGSSVIAPCHAPPYGDKATLSLVIGDEQLRTCIEKVTPNERSKNRITLWVGPMRQGDDVYPGPVKANAFPKLGARIGIILDRTSGTYVCEGPPPPQLQPDALGFVSRPIGYAYQKATQYQLPASLRGDNASRPLCIICAAILGSDTQRTCSITLNTPDGQVWMTLSWSILDFHGPDSLWLAYDTSIRTMANAIFVTRPKGDLQ